MSLSMETPQTPQHDLVAITAQLRGALLERVEQGIVSSGLANYCMYVIAKRLTFVGSLTVEQLTEQLRLDHRATADTLQAMEHRGLVRQEGDTWIATEAGRNALVAANGTGGEVLVQIREAIGPEACDQLVNGMRAALTALRKAA